MKKHKKNYSATVRSSFANRRLYYGMYQTVRSP